VDSVGADSEPVLSATRGPASWEDEGSFTMTVGVLGRDGVAAVEFGDPISCTRRRAVNISSSVKSPKGSRLLRIVPVKSVGSRRD